MLPRALAALAVAALLSPGFAQTSAPDPDADLRARKPPHESKLRTIEAERFAFQTDLAAREQACLKRFLSARCLETIRSEHLREMRRFDLLRETELQALRDIDAEIRQRVRSRKAEEKAVQQAS
jgi:hypothetical protein